MQAFHNDPALKAEMLKRVHSMLDAGQLIAAAVLRWMPEQSVYSYSGALVESGDNQVFEERSGIPALAALLCEATVAVSVIQIPDESRNLGYEFRTDADVSRFALQWIEAVRPGADLSKVVPQFMIAFLEFMLSSDFEQSAYISSGMRTAAEGILANWQSEFAGVAIDPKAWRVLRNEAVKVTENGQEAWSWPIAHFIETMAWPLKDISGEFQNPFMFVCGNWLAYLQRPFLAEEDRDISELTLKGHLLLRAEEERKGSVTPEEYQALLDANPDIKWAMTYRTDPVASARVKDGQTRAFAATTPRLRMLMNQLLKFIEAA